jgi:hypothetical protein
MRIKIKIRKKISRNAITMKTLPKLIIAMNRIKADRKIRIYIIIYL